MATTKLQANVLPGKGGNTFTDKEPSDGSEDTPEAGQGKNGPRKKSGIGPR